MRAVPPALQTFLVFFFFAKIEMLDDPSSDEEAHILSCSQVSVAIRISIFLFASLSLMRCSVPFSWFSCLILVYKLVYLSPVVDL